MGDLSKIITTCAILIFSVATSAQRTFSASDIEEAKKYKLSKYLLENWNKDSIGCSNLRCQFMDSISNNKSLIGLSDSTIIRFFGRPNQGSSDCYEYNLCLECNSKREPLVEMDKAWINFCFKNRILTDIVISIQ